MPSQGKLLIFKSFQITSDEIWDKISNIVMTHTHAKFQDFCGWRNVAGGGGISRGPHPLYETLLLYKGSIQFQIL